MRQRFRILIVEPDILFQYQLVEHFRSRGHAVTAVNNARYAPRSTETTFDVAIGEMEMMGYARSRKMRGGAIPVVVILTDDAKTAQEKNDDNIAASILKKPSNPGDVTRAISDHYNRQQ